MGNLENDDLEERASLKTITSDMTNNDNRDNNSVKSVNGKLIDKLSDIHSNALQNGEHKITNELPMKIVLSDENNEHQTVETYTTKVEDKKYETIDINAEVHAEDEKTNNSSNSTDTDDKEPSKIDNSNKISSNPFAENTESTEKSNSPTIQEQILNVKNLETNTKDSNKSESHVDAREDNSNDSEKHTIANTDPQKTDNKQTENNGKDLVEDPFEEQLEPNTKPHPATVHNDPPLKKYPLNRSVSDNYLIKSTNSRGSPTIIDPVNTCQIEIDNDVLIQNNINMYKSEATIENLTRLQILKRQISETLLNLKSKLTRNNKIKNGSSEGNVKLIRVESQSPIDEDDMLENIRTPQEMKHVASLGDPQDGETQGREEAWKVERDMQNGVDVLRSFTTNYVMP
ncbi:hypothetical protein WDU94_002445 [Cyamophila willieti]